MVVLLLGLRTVPVHDGLTAGYRYGTAVDKGLDNSVRRLCIPFDSSSAIQLQP